MFTGIIEALGNIISADEHGTNKTFWIRSPVSKELKVDQSLSHDGVCLTVEESNADAHKVTAVQETITKTNLGIWKPGALVNLERCLTINARLDGHIVQGHVDTTAQLEQLTDMSGSWVYTFVYPSHFKELVIDKGSISINGVSLTLFDVTDSRFTVAIIPFTYEHTNFKKLFVGADVNIEFDMLGKYVNRIMKFRNS